MSLILSQNTQQQVEDSLVKSGYLTEDKLKQLKEEAEDKKIPFLTYINSSGALSQEVITKTLAHLNNLPYVNLSKTYINPNALKLLPKEIAEQYMAIPLGQMDNRLVVAMLDADNVQMVDFLSNRIGQPLKVYAASEGGIRRVIKEYDTFISTDQSSDFDTAEEGHGEEGNQSQEFHLAASRVKTLVQDSPVSKTLSTILEFAARNRASDIHVEPMEKKLAIRVRIDGVLREVISLPKVLEPALVSRIKILSNLKIDEHRVPQDGQFTIRVNELEIDLRIAIAPVVWGEQVVIRLLDKTGTSLKLEDMGYLGRSLKTIKSALKETTGMILTSGPTGSGKSTSLYALIQEVKNDGVNIVTLEDPVEYKMSGINQIQVNTDVGLTFATGLRSILRQDPDIVMVGEIRDKETAQLAVQASLTGHLVFSTLHTNSAAGILPRLLDMDIEPFLIASTVHTVIGQRLLRRIGGKKTTYLSNEVETTAINTTIGNLLPKTKEEVEKVSESLGVPNLPLAGQKAYTLHRGEDSPDSPGGFHGRMGIYEAFNVNDEVQSLILKRATSAEIQRAAQKQGMVTMRQDGYLKALAGYTTINEVDRVAATDIA
jgi:type IV pilus assembly protein PilB